MESPEPQSCGGVGLEENAAEWNLKAPMSGRSEILPVQNRTPAPDEAGAK
jgi:hypothetical protein